LRGRPGDDSDKQMLTMTGCRFSATRVSRVTRCALARDALWLCGARAESQFSQKGVSVVSEGSSGTIILETRTAFSSCSTSRSCSSSPTMSSGQGLWERAVPYSGSRCACADASLASLAPSATSRRYLRALRGGGGGPAPAPLSLLEGPLPSSAGGAKIPPSCAVAKSPSDVIRHGPLNVQPT